MGRDGLQEGCAPIEKYLRGGLLLWGSVLTGLAVFGCGAYCILFYNPEELSFLTPDIGVVCWLYCSTKFLPLGLLTVATGGAMILGALMMRAGGARKAALLSLLSGLASLPVGLPNLLLALRALRGERESF